MNAEEMRRVAQTLIDDYGALEECRVAVDRYRADHGITEPLEEVDWGCVRWRKERQSPGAAH